MQERKTEPNPFITYLEGLAERDDRGALAALRRGLGEPPGTVPDMYPYVVPWLPGDWARDAYYLIASLFAMHPAGTDGGNLGAHFTRTRDPNSDNVAIERRFTALLAAHPDDLPFYLRQAVSFLRSKDVPINWHQLIKDTLSWDHPDRFVQQNWARAFWGRRQDESDNSDNQ